MKIKNLPKHERPREKLMEMGAGNLRDFELLAILFRTGRQGKSAIEIAQGVLKKHPMKKLLALDYENITKIKGIDAGKACTLLASFELVRRALEVEDNSLPTISSAEEALVHLDNIRSAKKEHFVALYLNARNQLVYKEIISIGILDASLVHPREVFKPAIDYLASSIIVAHNHPSGSLEPSQADLRLTDRLVEAGKVMGITLKDHLVLTSEGYVCIR